MIIEVNKKSKVQSNNENLKDLVKLESFDIL